MDQALADMQTRAAQHAVRSFLGMPGDLPRSMTRDDVRQEASVGVIAATKRLDRTRPSNEQEAYLARCALGAIRDACRRQRRGQHVELDAMATRPQAADGEDLDTPEQLAQVHEAMAAVARMPEPYPTVLGMTLLGSSGRHIADKLGVSAARVSQLRAKLAQQLSRFIAAPQRVPEFNDQ